MTIEGDRKRNDRTIPAHLRSTGTLSSRGQLVLPQAIRRLLRTKAGDRVTFVAVAPHSVLLTVRPAPTAESLYGILADQVPEELRNLEWDEIRRRMRLAKSGGFRAAEPDGES